MLYTLFFVKMNIAAPTCISSELCNPSFLNKLDVFKQGTSNDMLKDIGKRSICITTEEVKPSVAM